MTDTVIAGMETTVLVTGAATEDDIEDEVAEDTEDEETTGEDITVEEGIWAGITLTTGVVAVEEEVHIHLTREEITIGGISTTVLRGPLHKAMKEAATTTITKMDIKKDTTGTAMIMVAPRGRMKVVMGIPSRCIEEATREDIEGRMCPKTEEAIMAGRSTSHQSTPMEAIWDGENLQRRRLPQNQRLPSIRAHLGLEHRPTHGLPFSK